jgi:hypothetical protein
MNEDGSCEYRNAMWIPFSSDLWISGKAPIEEPNSDNPILLPCV